MVPTSTPKLVHFPREKKDFLQGSYPEQNTKAQNHKGMFHVCQQTAVAREPFSTKRKLLISAADKPTQTQEVPRKSDDRYTL